MEILTTVTFDALFKELPFVVQAKAAPKTDLFKDNPFHPSLRIEKLRPKNFNIWSFRIDLHYRIIFKFLGKNKAVFLFIGHHHEIYDYDLFK
ncbi:MAG: hypothetical protein V2B13_00955 [Pseudomonadota bacterium]